jgi:hypothetical protein
VLIIIVAVLAIERGEERGCFSSVIEFSYLCIMNCVVCTFAFVAIIYAVSVLTFVHK